MAGLLAVGGASAGVCVCACVRGPVCGCVAAPLGPRGLCRERRQALLCLFKKTASGAT